MRNKHRMSTLEQKFPLLAIEQEYIVSKDADITVSFALELPELFTISSEDYESMHSIWHKAIKVLPKYCVIHKQDWFIKEKYNADYNRDHLSFHIKSYEQHFTERPFLNHSVYLFITKTNRQRMMQQSNFSTLCRGNIIPKEIQDTDEMNAFIESVSQFEHIINSSGLLKLVRLTPDDLVGTDTKQGLIERYFSLNGNSHASLEDIQLGNSEVRVGDNILCLHTLSDTEDLPTRVGTDYRHELLSTSRSDCRLSFAAPVGLLLSCNHIYNQYIFIDDSDENLRKFEKDARNMHALSRYSRANQINQEWLEEYMNIAHSQGLISVRAHFNVIAWSDNRDELKGIKNDVGAALAMMECKPRHNTIDTGTLYWAAMPGNGADFPAEESFYTFIEPALCLFTAETNYKCSLSPFGIRMSDRITGKPIHLDISDLPMKQGIITNRNKFILGPSGSGKSFFTNHMARQYYEQGAHVLLVDTGNSYQGLCSIINQQTRDKDGIYITYQEDNPITFNPFYTDDRRFDLEKKNNIKAMFLVLWKRQDEEPTRAEDTALSGAINAYVKYISANPDHNPNFNGFYEFLRDDYIRVMESKKIREKDFDVHGFLNVLSPFYKGGDYDFLLNSDKDLDLTQKRFVVFELDNISGDSVLLPVVTLVIMETFLSKMRKLKGVRKMIIIEECWKALMSANMSGYIKYLFKTVRKFFGEAIVVTQEVDDIVSSPIVKDAIISNADCKILLDQRKYMNKFETIQQILGLTDKEKNQILSINQNLDPKRKYKEVWIGLNGKQSAVYATEESLEESLSYTTEEVEKMEVMELAAKMDGDIIGAIRHIANQKRQSS